MHPLYDASCDVFWRNRALRHSTPHSDNSLEWATYRGSFIPRLFAMTWYNTLVAVTSLFVLGAPTLLTSRSCYATDVPQRGALATSIRSADSFELRAFGTEADFWDGRAS